MELTLLIERVLPLYVVVFFGWVAGRFIGVRKESLAPIGVYLLTPIVVFSAVTRAPLNLESLTLPISFFFLSVSFCLIGYPLSKKLFPSPASNILGFMAGQGNSGYFGIPVGISIFGPEQLPAIVLCNLGFIFCENTVGFYIVARGHQSVKESLSRVLRLPSLYGLLLGMLANLMGISWQTADQGGGPVNDLLTMTRSTYSFLGMMIIGLAVADLKRFKPDLGFLSFALTIKFLAWPAITLLLILVDQATLGILTPASQRIVFFMSTIPPAANSVAYATLLNAEPHKTAVTVLLGTLLALAVVPILNAAFLYLSIPEQHVLNNASADLFNLLV